MDCIVYCRWKKTFGMFTFAKNSFQTENQESKKRQISPFNELQKKKIIFYVKEHSEPQCIQELSEPQSITCGLQWWSPFYHLSIKLAHLPTYINQPGVSSRGNGGDALYHFTLAFQFRLMQCLPVTGWYGPFCRKLQ